MPAMNKPPRRAGWLVPLLALLLAACDIVSPSVPDPSPSPLPAPSAAPTATPALAALAAPELLGRALRARANGDYDAAAVDLRALLDAHPTSAEARPAAFYLAESFALRNRWTSAIEAIRTFLASGPQPDALHPADDLYARGVFLLARGYEQAGTWADAAAAYERYRGFNTVLEPYARLRQAAQQQALGRNDAAAAGYEAVAAGEIVRGERAGAYEKAIALRLAIGQPDRALALYRALLDLAEAPGYRARLLLDAAALAEAQGAPAEAHAWRRELAERLPATPQALDALARLAADPEAGLAPAAAARVYAAHEQWDAALPLYDAAIQAASGDDARELRRLRALARRAQGDFAGALAELAELAAATPDRPVGRQAQLDWVQTTGQGGDAAAAIEGYRQFADAYPDDSLAPEALARAAALLARQNDAEGALAQRLELGHRYPDSDQAHDALYAAGWALFNAGKNGAAYAAWDLLRQHTTGAAAAQAAFWSARAREAQSPDYTAQLNAARAAAPDSYYAARAADLLSLPISGTLPLDAPIDADSWRAAEDWIATWSRQPPLHVGTQGYAAEVARAPQLQRALALADVGLQPEAIAEWNEARAAWRDDPVRLYQLARLAYEHGVPYIALKAAEDVLSLAPAQDGAATPLALRRLVFPVPYGDVMLAQARQHGLDPLLLYATLRQESLFNPGAVSAAGAVGLAQVMPATAQGIAQNLGVADFATADLYRPAVGIRFGAFYLSRQIAAMSGSLPGGLAAYNGGLGNAQRWAGGDSVPDTDRFVESIDYPETRAYVKLIYGYYAAYRGLYAAP